MKEIQKNSLFNYFSKKKPSEGEANTENRQGEISKLKNSNDAGKKENRPDQENDRGEEEANDGKVSISQKWVAVEDCDEDADVGAEEGEQNPSLK